MTLLDLRDRFASGARATRGDIEELRGLVECDDEFNDGDDPFAAITLVADWKLRQLIPSVVRRIEDSDPMIRWNALSVIFVRLRDPEHVDKCLECAVSDPDSMARSAALRGLGEILPLIGRSSKKGKRVALLLLATLEDEEALIEYRDSAYEGIQAALEVSPPDRLDAGRMIDPATDVDPAAVEKFRDLYLAEP